MVVFYVVTSKRDRKRLTNTLADTKANKRPVDNPSLESTDQNDFVGILYRGHLIVESTEKSLLNTQKIRQRNPGT